MKNIKPILGFFVVASAVLFANVSHGETLYLNCETIKSPDNILSKMYLVPPATNNEYVNDIVEAGFVGMTMPPDTTWTIDLDNMTVSQPGDSRIYKIVDKDTSAISAVLSRQGSDVSFSILLNRINGVLTVEHTILSTSSDIQEWRVKHGKAFPTIWTWEQKCVSGHPKF